MSTFTFKENEYFSIDSPELSSKIISGEICFDSPTSLERRTTPRHLGITYDFNKKTDPFFSSYYIGADWIDKDNSITITPKVDSLDFIKLFSAALDMDTKRGTDYFSNCYGIDLDGKEIEIEASFNVLTPLLLLHYLSTLRNALKYGLRKGYVNREENLKGKIKGRIKVSKDLRKNVMQHRIDHVYCAFQEYTEDIPENRLLKKALIFAMKGINQLKAFNGTQEFIDAYNKLIPLFSNVSDKIEVHEISSISNNKLFQGYAEAIRLAKMVLRSYDYALDNVDEAPRKSTTLPFWIDMSALFEMYVLSILDRSFPGQILYQVPGSRQTKMDYMKKASGDDKEIIFIDAKYKDRYLYGNSNQIDDIREISGYARDRKLLETAGLELNAVPQCLIIYPYPDKFTKDELVLEAPIIQRSQAIDDFNEFYKLGVPLPVMR